MPECGLYYFSTHYSNWGHPRRYTDPEPQQFLYWPHAYCGIAFNFHDAFGFRDSLVATAAFSPFIIFGHIDLRMPEPDVQFARRFLQWIEANADILRRGRVCFESAEAAVVSKIQGDQGAVFLVNYGVTPRRFQLKVEAGGPAVLHWRQVYPVCGAQSETRNGGTMEVDVRPESVAILEVGGAFSDLPPQNPSAFPIPLADWTGTASGEWQTEFTMPDLSEVLAKSRDPSLPEELASLEQRGQAIPELAVGPLPERFLSIYGFREDRVDSWKLIPWAFADRVWLVHQPDVTCLLGDDPPGVQVNGSPVRLVPRVDYRLKLPKAEWTKNAAQWTCPLFFADLTDVLCYGGRNVVALTGLRQETPGRWLIMSAADRTPS
jgi:hypothetical protein